MKKSIFALIILSVFAFFTACESDDNDTTKPTISLVKPAMDQSVFIGYEMHLELDLVDNEALKSYKVDIHSNKDGHNHTKSLKVVSTADWTYTKSWDVSGKNTHIHHHEITVPAEINGLPITQGEYHLMIYCTDIAGNESYIVSDIVIEERVSLVE